jgi:ADP-heptose:LPS heptosyltransferase
MNLRIARYIDRWFGLFLSFAIWAINRAFGRLPALGATTPPVDGPLAQPRRVLGIKFYGLGNIAMILPTVASVRGDGEVEFDFLTLSGNRSLLEQSGLVSRVLTVDVDSFPSFLRSVLRLLRELRGGYDAVLDFEQFMKLSSILGSLTNAPAVVGFNTDGQARGWLYTHRVAYADTDHMADIFMRLAVPLGRETLPAPLIRLSIEPTDRENIEARFSSDAAHPLVLMHVGTGPNFDKIAIKRWPASNFAALADYLVRERGYRVVFTGVGEEENGLVEEVVGMMQEAHAATNASDALTVGELTALLAHSLCVVTNDTSILHLAGLVHTPAVTFFGPTEPRLYGPRGPLDLVFYEQLFCSPCLSNYNLKISRCVNPVCMQRIEVPRVIETMEREFFPRLDHAAALSRQEGRS